MGQILLRGTQKLLQGHQKMPVNVKLTRILWGWLTETDWALLHQFLLLLYNLCHSVNGLKGPVSHDCEQSA